jgi:hypothetical protein
MPKFYEYQEVEAQIDIYVDRRRRYRFEIDIDVDDFLNKCSSREIDELIDALIEDGHISKEAKDNVYDSYNVSEAQYQEALKKLRGRWNMLTKEEEETILKIANRF